MNYINKNNQVQLFFALVLLIFSVYAFFNPYDFCPNRPCGGGALTSCKTICTPVGVPYSNQAAIFALVLSVVIVFINLRKNRKDAGLEASKLGGRVEGGVNGKSLTKNGYLILITVKVLGIMSFVVSLFYYFLVSRYVKFNFSYVEGYNFGDIWFCLSAFSIVFGMLLLALGNRYSSKRRENQATEKEVKILMIMNIICVMLVIVPLILFMIYISNNYLLNSMLDFNTFTAV